MNVEKIGRTIKELRLRAGYTQAELAECLNITDKAVSRWERCLGIPDVSLLAKLCNVLDTDIENLLEGNIAFLRPAWRGVLLQKNRGWNTALRRLMTIIHMPESSILA